MKSAVIYARYSSNAQTEQSIEGQLTVCEKYARDNNLLIVNTYIDRAMTGTNDNRAAFQQMLSDSKNDCIKKKNCCFSQKYLLNPLQFLKFSDIINKIGLLYYFENTGR